MSAVLTSVFVFNFFIVFLVSSSIFWNCLVYGSCQEFILGLCLSYRAQSNSFIIYSFIFIHLLTHLTTNLLIHLLTFSLTHSFIHSSISLPISFIYSSLYLLIDSFISFIYTIAHWFIHLPIYLFILSLICSFLNSVNLSTLQRFSDPSEMRSPEPGSGETQMVVQTIG